MNKYKEKGMDATTVKVIVYLLRVSVINFLKELSIVIRKKYYINV